MVLHLLGKKSWNVYNSDNVERVRQDEARARELEEAEEQRMQEDDAARRIAILRGEQPPELPRSTAEDADLDQSRRQERDDNRPRKRRRLRGEDDTDRDIRYAREDTEAGDKAKKALSKPKDDRDVPLIDHAGHLQLIPELHKKASREIEKNAEAEAEKAKKRKRDEDQYTMRFSNAAGFNNGMQKPWYATSKQSAAAESMSNALVLADVQDKDVWGNEDPRRKERERSRISSSDPFAAMQQAQRQLKQSERDKENWKKERGLEIEELKRAEERRRRESKNRDRDEESLEGFNLDASAASKHGRSDRERDSRRHHHRHRHGSRSRDRSRDRHKRSRHH